VDETSSTNRTGQAPAPSRPAAGGTSVQLAAPPTGGRPEPDWHTDIPDLDASGLQILRIPAGLWLRQPGGVDLSDDELCEEPPDKERMYVVLGAPGEQPPDPRSVADVLRALPDGVRDDAVLCWYGGSQAAGAVAEALSAPVRAVHGVPSDGVLVFVDQDGVECWRPFVQESVYRPAGPPRLTRWSSPPGLLQVEPGSFGLFDGWRVDVVPRGLLVRPESVRAMPAWGGGTGPTADVVVVPAEDVGVPIEVVIALDDVLRELPEGTRQCLRLLPVDDIAADALAASEHAGAVVRGESGVVLPSANPPQPVAPQPASPQNSAPQPQSPAAQWRLVPPTPAGAPTGDREPAPSGELEPARPAEPQPARSAEPEPVLSGELESALSGGPEPVPTADREPAPPGEPGPVPTRAPMPATTPPPMVALASVPQPAQQVTPDDGAQSRPASTTQPDASAMPSRSASVADRPETPTGAVYVAVDGRILPAQPIVRRSVLTGSMLPPAPRPRQDPGAGAPRHPDTQSFRRGDDRTPAGVAPVHSGPAAAVAELPPSGPATAPQPEPTPQQPVQPSQAPAASSKEGPVATRTASATPLPHSGGLGVATATQESPTAAPARPTPSVPAPTSHAARSAPRAPEKPAGDVVSGAPNAGANTTAAAVTTTSAQATRKPAPVAARGSEADLLPTTLATVSQLRPPPTATRVEQQPQADRRKHTEQQAQADRRKHTDQQPQADRQKHTAHQADRQNHTDQRAKVVTEAKPRAEQTGTGNTAVTQRPAKQAPRSQTLARPAPAAAIEVPEGVRSTDEQRRGVRKKLGSVFDSASRSVTRLLSERPGLRFGAKDDAAVLAELSVVRVFADNPAGSYDNDFYVCLASGLRRLPTARAVVVRSIPTNLYLQPEMIVRVPAPVLTSPVAVAPPPGGPEALIWTTSGRRLDGLLDEVRSTKNGDGAHPDDVVLTGHTRLRVLAVESSPVQRLLLAEEGAAHDAALTRLQAAATARTVAAATPEGPEVRPWFHIVSGA
jgi:hypothetical protein